MDCTLSPSSPEILPAYCAGTVLGKFPHTHTANGAQALPLNLNVTVASSILTCAKTGSFFHPQPHFARQCLLSLVVSQATCGSICTGAANSPRWGQENLKHVHRLPFSLFYRTRPPQNGGVPFGVPSKPRRGYPQRRHTQEYKAQLVTLLKANSGHAPHWAN